MDQFSNLKWLKNTVGINSPLNAQNMPSAEYNRLFGWLWYQKGNTRFTHFYFLTRDDR